MSSWGSAKGIEQATNTMPSPKLKAVAKRMMEVAARFPGATLDQAFGGGEDYELLFTVRPRTEVPQAFRRIPLTRIGTMRKGRPGRVEFEGHPLPARGYDHFAERRTRLQE